MRSPAPQVEARAVALLAQRVTIQGNLEETPHSQSCTAGRAEKCSVECALLTNTGTVCRFPPQLPHLCLFFSLRVVLQAITPFSSPGPSSGSASRTRASSSRTSRSLTTATTRSRRSSTTGWRRCTRRGCSLRRSPPQKNNSVRLHPHRAELLEECSAE